MQRNLEKAVK